MFSAIDKLVVLNCSWFFNTFFHGYVAGDFSRERVQYLAQVISR